MEFMNEPQKAVLAQKYMVQRANLACKPVISFMNVFDSMTIIPDPNNPDEIVKSEAEIRPTRGEAQDVLCQIQDGVDAIMLHKET